jgi:type IV pilus assembly protein PilX
MGFLKPPPTCLIKRSHESGVVLIVTIVILIIVTVGTLSVVRSMDTSNVISGNFAFKQAVMHVSDRGISDATNSLDTIVGTGRANITNRQEQYFAVREAKTDSLGIPSSIDWATVPCRYETEENCDGPDKDNRRYRIQYFIERQCRSMPDLTDDKSIKENCDYEIRRRSPEEIAVRYRIIVRVRGPKNATGIYEAMVSGPATN